MKLDISYGPRYLYAARPWGCLVCGVGVEPGDYAYPLFDGAGVTPDGVCHEQCLP